MKTYSDMILCLIFLLQKNFYPRQSWWCWKSQMKPFYGSPDNKYEDYCKMSKTSVCSDSTDGRMDDPTLREQTVYMKLTLRVLGDLLIPSSPRSFAHTAHSLASLTCSAALIRSLARQLTPELMEKSFFLWDGWVDFIQGHSKKAFWKLRLWEVRFVVFWL